MLNEFVRSFWRKKSRFYLTSKRHKVRPGAIVSITLANVTKVEGRSCWTEKSNNVLKIEYANSDQFTSIVFFYSFCSSLSDFSISNSSQSLIQDATLYRPTLVHLIIECHRILTMRSTHPQKTWNWQRTVGRHRGDTSPTRSMLYSVIVS